jgi:hypothetical protein
MALEAGAVSTPRQPSELSSDSSRDRRLGRGLLALALVVAAVGMSPSLEPGVWRQSWLGHNGARYAHIARNYVRNGPLHLNAAPLLDAERVGAPGRGDRAGPQDGPGPGRPPEVYANHPPGVSLLVAAAFALGGVQETSARLVPALATLLSLVLLAWLVGGETRSVTGGLAALLAAAMPMTGTYGAHVDPQGSLPLAAGLGVLLAYQRWLRGGALWPLLVVSAVGSSFDWWALYMPAGCALHLAFARGQWRAAFGMAAWTGLLFGGWLFWMTQLPGMSLEHMLGAAGVRGPGRLLSELGSAPVRDQLAQWFAHSRRLMPGWPALLALSAAVMGGRLLGGQRGRTLGAPALVALLVLPAVAHGLIFPAGMLVHSYWLFGLPVGLGAGLALALAPLRPAVSVFGVGALLLAGGGLGWPDRGRALPDAADEVPATLGSLLAVAIPPEGVVLTNYDANPLLPGAVDGAHLTKRPELLYYADRTVRGLAVLPDNGRDPDRDRGPEDLAALEDALARVPDARWFLLVPWPVEPSPALRAALHERSSEPPTRLHPEADVWLFELAP